VTGREGRSCIEGLFQQLEMQTIGWTSERRALLLYSKLEGIARMNVDCLGDSARIHYEEMKAALLDATNGHSLQFTAQQQHK
jgi:hypothetical protein